MYRILALSLAASLGIAVPTPAGAQQAQPLRIDLNIPALQLTVYEGDTELKRYRVSVGKAGHDTPDGRFEITHAEWNPWWRPPEGREWTRGREITPPGLNNPMGRVKLFFMPLYFIHGTPERESIGTPASHGCVRMLNSEVIELARLIHERAAPHVSQAEITRILAQPRQTRRVNLRTPVEVVIRYDPVVVENQQIRVYPDLYKRNAIHAEAVYQALLAAGYDTGTVRGEDVQKFVQRARQSRTTFAVSLSEAFGTLAVNTAASGAAAGR
jgi:murein L,D-transpeptidase YcbB/YkuD